MNEIDLRGRVAVITGGSNGIGKAIVERFAASGATVENWDVEKSEAGKNVTTTLVDVTDNAAVTAAAAEAKARHGRIDILIANAGISGPDFTTWDYPVSEWQRVMRINVEGTFFCCKAVIPTMLEGDYGRIVAVASVAGKEGNARMPAYSASKAAIISMTKSLGKELANKNIAVNCVTPAAAETRIHGQTSAEQLKVMLSKIPRGRFVEPSEIASMVAWLASEENSFATGGVFDISGGRATY
ncbi:MULTISPECIES: SDR family NAD(P)-dependent oxidoreductase [unclassified Bradyrhizobium]|uniref:SDR family NAD(P)-dependent oxidoreductase n=1 Tax=unclassified Bradyrhizobium TaxID=2631580 RepID=UPI00230651C0|nr:MULTISPECIES: SDR family NAD(P)-dependent oxidoreductase [unclassified Bradyrhizobium]MDA9451223.1 3-oxoacyl-ACP reductase [Bradyrhizobium sp. CCBAU 21360]MDA9457602.1 3-oxoacyl-ACP reductase [Bradyrhizobium sp. CCBAU 21359]